MLRKRLPEELSFFRILSRPNHANNLRRGKVILAEAPWSAAEWAVALLFVELLQAQPGRHRRYLRINPSILDRIPPAHPPIENGRKSHSVCYMFAY